LLSHYYFAKKELLKHEFDIVHLNSSVLTDWLYPAKNKGKVIIHIREPLRKGKLDILYYFFTSQMRRYADHIIAISNDNAQRVNVPSKTTVVYNYSNVENIDELNIKEYSSKSVLYVGGLAEIKGFYNMVEALPFINDDIKVYFAGYYNTSLSNDHSNVTLKIKLKRILKKILFRKETMLYNNFVRSSKAINIGLLSDINEYLDQTVCLISPFSLPHFARPIIESYARRKPAIATKIDGMDELIDHDKTGFLVELGNPQSLANNINLLCENPKVAKEMGNNGYLKAKSNFSQNNNNQILDVFDNLFN
jgi:glycosyltransferase involved in cell wall biosynthesis